MFSVLRFLCSFYKLQVSQFPQQYEKLLCHNTNNGAYNRCEKSHARATVANFESLIKKFQNYHFAHFKTFFIENSIDSV